MVSGLFVGNSGGSVRGQLALPLIFVWVFILRMQFADRSFFSRAFGARQSRHRLSGAHWDVRVVRFLRFCLGRARGRRGQNVTKNFYCTNR